jgi:hypothetical protein
VTWTDPNPVDVIEGAVDLVADALEKLPQQLRDVEDWQKMITVLVKPFQRIENTIVLLLTLRGINTASGAQLDRIGRIVKEPRNGETDDEVYRRRIRARISQKRSRGTVENLITVAVLLVFDEDARIVVDQQGMAAAVVRVEDITVAESLGVLLIEFLQATAADGVRIIVEYSEVEEDDSFRFGRQAFLSGAHLAGATTLVTRPDYTDLTRFPSSGSAVLDRGTAVEETVTFASHDDYQLLGVSATVHDHADGCAVCPTTGLVGKGFPAGGFFVEAEATIDLIDEDNSPTTVVFEPGVYSRADVLAIVRAHLPGSVHADWTFDVDISGVASFSYPHSIISVIWSTAALRSLFGFSADATDYDSTGDGPFTGDAAILFDPTNGGALAAAKEES